MSDCAVSLLTYLWHYLVVRMLYDHLLSAGVEVYEYCARPMHGKVALVDDEWATVGSSNLEPLSLSLNLEANLVVRDRAFNREMRERLDPLLRERCKRIEVEHTAARRWWWRLGVGYLVFHLLRHFPRWAAWLPPTQITVMRGRTGLPSFTRSSAVQCPTWLFITSPRSPAFSGR